MQNTLQYFLTFKHTIMKKNTLVFLLVCFCLCKSSAQQNHYFDSSGYYQYSSGTFLTPMNDDIFDPTTHINNALQYLDMSKVPYGVLYDKVVSISGLLNFDDTLQHNDTSNPLNFHQAYYEYYHSLINNSSDISPDSLINIIATEYAGVIHPLVFFKANISTIDTNAVHSGILTTDENHQLHDGGDTILSPYDSHHVTLASLGITTVDLPVGEHKIVLDPRFFLGNDKTRNITDIAFTFSNDTHVGEFSLTGVDPSSYSSLSPV